MTTSLPVLSKPCFDAYESLIHIVLYYQVLLYYFFTQSFTNYYAIDIHKHGNNHNFAKFSKELYYRPHWLTTCSVNCFLVD